jgi:DNA mismatch repair protein MLH3
VSLLSITSQHQAEADECTVSFHQSRVLARFRTVQEHHRVLHKIHGTKVTVRDLFGKLPVRVKHRAIHYEYQENLDKEFEDLKRKIVALLLAWSRPVQVVLSDTKKKRRCILRLNQESLSRVEGDSGTHAKLPFGLNWICPLLVQAGYIVHPSFASWVTASARTSMTSIRAAISLEPVPTKQIQFISFGVRPVDPVHGSQVLFSEVNHMFALSSFGAIEDDIEMSRHHNAKRYKSDEYTTRQLKGIAKGADRWPMFYIRVDSSFEHGLQDDDRMHDSGGDAACTLHNVLQLLKTLVYQFLDEHHFRPRARKQKVRRQSNDMAHKQDSFSDPVADTRLKEVPLRSADSTTSLAGSATQPNVSKLRRLVIGRGFDSWSRVKSGKRDGFEDIISGLPQSKSLQGYARAATAPAASSHGHNSKVDIGQMTPAKAQLQLPLDHDIRLLLQDLQKEDLASDSDGEGVSNGVPLPIVYVSNAPKTEEEDALQRDNLPVDETMLWTNPNTGRVVHINSRTGLIVPDLRGQGGDIEVTEDGQCSEPLVEAVLAPRTNSARTLRLTHKVTQSDLHVEPGSWVGKLLRGSEDSMFRQLEAAIPSIAAEEAIKYDETFPCCHPKFGTGSLKQVSALFNVRTTVTKLSKGGLDDSQVLAQIDRKFILVKIKTDQTHGQVDGANGQPLLEETVLVLIDQHAADERCQVEALFAELCKVETVQLRKPIYFEVSKQEIRLLEQQKEFFAGWGFQYEMQTEEAHGAPQVASSKPHTQPTSTQSNDNFRIIVIALPNVIAERCRLDPKILIDLLRSEIWIRAENGFAKSRAGVSRQESDSGRSGLDASGRGENEWLTKISTCPKGLIEMLNSRACRTAIMFNDELSMEECKALVKRLAKCSFPFQCAHGRPSMVVLGELGPVDAGEEQLLGPGTVQEDVEDGDDFTTAFDSWQANIGKGSVGE